MTAFAHRLPGYALALALVLGAALVSLLFAPEVAGSPSALFVAAVFLSAWYGEGLGGGLLATVLSAIVFDFLYVDTPLLLHVATPRGAIGLLGFVGVNLLITVLTASLRRRLAEERAQSQRLAGQVQALTIEIDRAKATQEVDAITDSDYFRGLQAKARGLRASRSPTEP